MTENDPLDEYRAKRQPGATPEPIPDRAGGGGDDGSARFVVHEHHARRLHWDLRLERNGVLACWAVPRGLPPSPDHNHLAVHTEDHPLEYLDFTGDIPAGQYGAGSMSTWDRGTYEVERFDDREVKIVLHGDRVEGRHVLFATSGRDWMIRRMDPPRSGWVAPPDQLPVMQPVDGPFPGEAGWVLEPAWDGVRAVVTAERAGVRVAVGGTDDVTAWCRNLRDLVDVLGTVDAILDGVLVVVGDDGVDGAAARQRLPPIKAEPPRAMRAEPLTFIAFDLLHFDGRQLLDDPWHARRQALEELDLPQPSFERSPSFAEPLEPVVEALVGQGFDRAIAKHTESRYRPGERNGDWRRVELRG